MYDGSKTSLNSRAGDIYNSQESKSYFHGRTISYKKWVTHRPHNIQVNAPKGIKGNKSLRTVGPHFWNSLPKHIKAETISQNSKNI